MRAGPKFRKALVANQPLQIVGTVNAYSAMMAKKNRPSSYLLFRRWGGQCLLWFT